MMVVGRTGAVDPLLVDTCVLLPQELSLRSEAMHPILSTVVPSLFGVTHPLFSLPEDRLTLSATKTIPLHTRYFPFSGTVRAGKLPIFPVLPAFDPRQRYGCYDEVVQRSSGRVRTCNWVRFLKVAPQFSPQVNIVGTKTRGTVIFEVVREMSPGETLVAFLLPEAATEDNILLPALQMLRTSLVRRTIDSIMAEAPLDLSCSLLTENPKPLEENPLPSSPFFHPHLSLRLGLLPPPLLSSPNKKSHPFVFPYLQKFPLEPPTAVTSSQESPVRSPPSLVASPRASSPTPAPPKRRERTMLPCSECGKAFDRPSLLKRHIRTHTGEKPHVCDVCGKGFSTSSSLNTHRRIHSGEKPHQCGICGKRFTASSNLYYHRMTHIKEKPHKCALCTRSFPTPGDLRSHMFVHNGQWPHKCSVCGKGFSKLTNLKNHSLLHAEFKGMSHSLAVASTPLAIDHHSKITEEPIVVFSQDTHSSALDINSNVSSPLNKHIESELIGKRLSDEIERNKELECKPDRIKVAIDKKFKNEETEIHSVKKPKFDVESTEVKTNLRGSFTFDNMEVNDTSSNSKCDATPTATACETNNRISVSEWTQSNTAGTKITLAEDVSKVALECATQSVEVVLNPAANSEAIHQDRIAVEV